MVPMVRQNSSRSNRPPSSLALEPWDFAQETQTSGAEHRKTPAFKLRYR